MSATTPLSYDLVGVRFEVACECVGAVIAYYAAELGKEMAKPTPDQARISEILDKQNRLDELRSKINPRDAVEIEAVIQIYGSLARRLYEE
jgi:hypothetical protein